MKEKLNWSFLVLILLFLLTGDARAAKLNTFSVMEFWCVDGAARCSSDADCPTVGDLCIGSHCTTSQRCLTDSDCKNPKDHGTCEALSVTYACKRKSGSCTLVNKKID